MEKGSFFCPVGWHDSKLEIFTSGYRARCFSDLPDPSSPTFPTGGPPPSQPCPNIHRRSGPPSGPSRSTGPRRLLVLSEVNLHLQGTSTLQKYGPRFETVGINFRVSRRLHRDTTNPQTTHTHETYRQCTLTLRQETHTTLCLEV